MPKTSRIALLAVAVMLPTGVARAEETSGAPAKIVGLRAIPGSGRTLLRIETTSSSVNYISYTRDPTTVVVKLYGLEAEDIPAELEVRSPEVRAVRFTHLPASKGYSSVSEFLIERARPGSTPIRLEGSTLVVEAGPEQRAAVIKPPATVAATPVARPARPATRIERIAAEPLGDGLAVSVRGDGELRYQSFTLDDPPRLVLDFEDVLNRVDTAELRVSHEALKRVRVSQYQLEPRVARVVLDLGRPEDYRVSSSSGELRVLFGSAASMSPELAPVPTEVGSAEEAAEGVPPAVPDAAATARVAPPEATVHGAMPEEEGTLISLDLKNADIQDVLRYFSEISGLNIILDPGVTGTVTLRLIEVPWNKALDIILKTHGYGKTLDGNVLRIADVGKLTSEESSAAELELKRMENRPLVTITRQISYANAQEVATVVERTALSKKGSIIIDSRTNTLVITEVDLPEYRQRILDIVRTLDTPTPQVEIEARIVETTRAFAESFGIQWGFNHSFDATTGSTTDLAFPNSGVISGDLIAGDTGFRSTLPGQGWAVNLPTAGNGAIGLHLANIDNTFQLDLALSALENQGHGRILSAPKITTQSNIAASIVSGQSIPVQTIANNTITVQYLATNLQLNVTPQVTADNTVVLKVTVDNSSADLSTRIGAAALPPINQRRAQTQLMVPDGGTAVIGGVFQLNESESSARLPYLHRIPVLGWLFKNRTLSRQNNELLIFITPKIKRPKGFGTGVPVAANPMESQG